MLGHALYTFRLNHLKRCWCCFIAFAPCTLAYASDGSERCAASFPGSSKDHLVTDGQWTVWSSWRQDPYGNRDQVVCIVSMITLVSVLDRHLR